jgi:hypothetical protein
MSKGDFQLKHDSQGRRYYQNVAKYETSNHRGDDLMDEDTDSARIYEITGKWPIFVMFFLKHCLLTCSRPEYS